MRRARDLHAGNGAILTPAVIASSAVRRAANAPSMTRAGKMWYRSTLRDGIVLLIAGLAAALSLTVLADDERGTWSEPPAEEAYSDPWSTEYEDPFANPGEETDESGPDRLRIYDDLGRRTGRVEKDPIVEGSYNLYDRLGRRTGRVDEGLFRDDSFTVYDEKGRRVRDIRKNPSLDDHYDVFDTGGRRIGRIRESSVIEGQYDIFDEKGRRIGRVESD